MTKIVKGSKSVTVKTVQDLIFALQSIAPETQIKSIEFGPDDSFLVRELALFTQDQKLIFTSLSQSEQNEYREWLEADSPEAVY